jgi:hypothetical protein
MPPCDVPPPCLGDVLLSRRLGAAEARQPEADSLVSHCHGACVENAGHERLPDQIGRRPHGAGARWWPGGSRAGELCTGP